MSTENIRREAMNRMPSANCRPECPTARGMSAAEVGAKPAITRDMAMKPAAPACEDDPGVGERDDHPAQRGQEHPGTLPEDGVEGDRTHHVLACDEAREECLPAGKVKADDEGDRTGDGKHMPYRDHPAAVEDGEQSKQDGDA